MKTMYLNRIPGFVISLLLLWILAGCTDYTIPDKRKKIISAASCEGCHTNYERLIEVHSPDTTAPAGGCGGEAPHYEPYDRVFIGGEGYESFKASGHYGIGCTGCHNGDGSTGDKVQAHSGGWIASPSMFYEEKCNTCHEEVTAVFASSLHNGTGQKRKVAMRSGLSGAGAFDQLPAHQIEGYNNNCAHCHGTCGNCHVVRPAIAGGGLSGGHNFNKVPDWRKVCVNCHTSRGGHAYLGVAAGTQPSVHLTGADFDCLSCHDGMELHGDGNPVEQRYAYTELPECEDCHSGLETSNTYHTVHYNSFNCHVCHSQDYNNCGSCHIHGDGARIPAYLDYKIAMNPIPDIRPGYEFALVRRTLAAPDNWEKYGVEEYASFNAHPTYNYTTPYNILKRTARTPEGAGCSTGCHIRIEEGDTINKDLYLWQADLLEWEIEATSAVTVDGKLPAQWLQ
jgi:hypothetical protein